MGQQLELKITGLNTHPSPFGAKGGSLEIAKNININAPNTASSRRGSKKYGDQIVLSGSNRYEGFFNFDDSIIVHYGDQLYLDSDDAGTWSAYVGDFEAQDGNIGIRGIKNNGSIYLTTSDGVKKLDDKAGTWVDAGGIKGLGGVGSTTGSSGFFTNNKQIAYRVVWGYTDTNDLVVLGSPSERIEVTNTSGGTRDVELTFYIPQGITTSWFYQIYRSSFSADQNTVSNDELGLVYEDFPTAAEITAGSITLTDNTPDSLRGATIYTASTQEGIDQANEVPPLSKDITLYKNVALFANTQTKHRFYLTLLATGGDAGITIPDEITIDSTTYTGASTENASAGEFKIFDTGDVSGDISNTARSLVNVINQYSTNTTINAYYISGYDDLPGQMLLEKITLDSTAFSVSFETINTGGDHSKAWNPTLTSARTSENEIKPNRVYISKPNQVDAVPLVNFLDVGSGNSAITRIIALRDSVFMFKDDGEVHRLVGDDITTFAVSLFDNTTKLLAAKTALPFNNQIYGFADQGIVAVSDTGIAIKSWDIQDELEQYFGDTNFHTTGYAISYESDNKYILSLGAECLVYNSLTNTWTKWDVNRQAGFVNSTDDKLYWGDSDGYVYQERKAFEIFDYADDSFDVTIVSSDNYDVTVNSLDNIVIGMSLKQGSRYAYITAFATDNVVTVDEIQTWTAGAATVNENIDCQLKWIPIYTENPGVMKRFREITTTFRDMNEEFDVITSNNFSPTGETTTTITPTFEGTGFGSLAWGSGPWGGTTSGSQENRTYFPLDQQRALWVFVTVRTQRAFTKFTLNAVSVMFEPTSERFYK